MSLTELGTCASDRCFLLIMRCAGQCNDAIFRLGRAGVLSVLVDSVASFARDGVFLRSGRFLAADMVVMAAGCKQTAQPPFLHEMGLGAACHRRCWLRVKASGQALQVVRESRALHSGKQGMSLTSG